VLCAFMLLSVHAVRAVPQYYTSDRQYERPYVESLPRARATFPSVFGAFSVPPPLRAVCLPFALRLSEHNLPALDQDNRGIPEPDLLDLIHSRVYSTARTLRVREHWQSTTYRTEPAQPEDTAVSRFGRMIARLSQLQSQLLPRIHTAAMPADKILDTVRGEWFAAPRISGASHSNPHELAAHAQLVLATGTPGIHSPASLSAPPSPDAAVVTAFLTPTPTAPPAASPFDTSTGDTTSPDDSAPNEVFNVLRLFRGGADRPHRTEKSPVFPYRGLDPANPCRFCSGTNHLARTCPSLRPSKPAAPAAARFAFPNTTSAVLPRSPTPSPAFPAYNPPPTNPIDCDSA